MPKSIYSRRALSWYLPLVLSAVTLAILVFLFIEFSGAILASGSWQLLSVISGSIGFALAVGIYYYLWPRAGLVPLLGFHFILSCLLLASTHWNPKLGMIVIAAATFLPSGLLHFGILLSHTLVHVKLPKAVWFTYALSSIVAGYGLWWALADSGSLFETLRWTVGYGLAAYLIWIGYLVSSLISSQPMLEKIVPRYLLICQVLFFIAPALVLVVLCRVFPTFPIAGCAPLAALFPLSLWLGMIPAQRRQLQTYIVQSEKRVALGELLAGLSHELNNPLNYVHSSLEPLQDSIDQLKSRIAAPDEKTVKIFEQLDRMVKNMEDGMSRAQVLLENFRNMPSGRRPMKESIDLRVLIDGCIERLGNKWKGKVEFDCCYEEIPEILGVSGELEQAFSNLIGNAIDASPVGGVITVSVATASAGIKVSIRDAGEGISREAIGKIFDPFFTTKQQGKGQGLGLAITLQIIKQHRGSIEVRSDPGRGAEFIVFFPN